MRLLLRISALLTLLALFLMCWSVLDPTVLPVMVAMTIGQGIGTIAFGLYGYVIFHDVRRTQRARNSSLNVFAPPPRKPGGEPKT